MNILGYLFPIGCLAYNAMKQHIEVGIMAAMAAMMVFGAAAYIMPFVYAASSSTGKGDAAGKEDNAGSTTTGGGTSHPPSTYKPCNPSNCKGTPGYYTTVSYTHLTLPTICSV